jgi:hypothetical protein
MITEPLDAPQLNINAICGTCGTFAPTGPVLGRCRKPAESGRDGMIESETRACRLHEIMMTEASP